MKSSTSVALWQEGDEREEANEQLGGALCALAERLLGSAEELASVAAECQQLLDRAQSIFPDSPEPLQVTFICAVSAGDHRIPPATTATVTSAQDVARHRAGLCNTL